jgi:hypothetical protein
MTNAPTFDISTARDDLIEAIKQSQELTLDAVKAVAGIVSPIVDALPKSPFADQLPQLPQPSEAIDAGYAFVAELLEAQRDFNLRLAEALMPKAA